MPRLHSPRAHWIAIIAVALGVRLAAGAWWETRLAGGQRFYFADSVSYWELGRAIASGHDYSYPTAEDQVFRAPGYPLLLAGLFALGGEDPPVMAARALNAVLGAVSVALIGWWTAQLFDARAGRCAGWLAAVYPGAVAMSAFVLSEAPFCPFMLLELALWSAAWRTPSGPRAAGLAALGGAAGAAATLIRPSWLLFTPLAIIVSVVADKRHARQLLLGLALSVAFVCGMLPWWIRNARVTGHFVATTLQFGASLYDGLNPAADGSSNMDFVPRFAAAEHELDGTPAAAGETFEYRLNGRLSAAAWDWTRNDPMRAVQLAGIKFLRMWNIWPNEPALRSWPLRLAVFVSYVPLLACSLWGVWRFTSRGWPYVLAWLPAVYLTLVHVVFIGSIRYREPAMLALIALAAGALASKAPERGGDDPGRDDPGRLGAAAR
jgi:4-amino-4-deoxy-L-arabinose transferase-like glycosyltransferase